MIIGRDLLKKLKMDVLYSDNIVQWADLKLPMQQVNIKEQWIDFNAIYPRQKSGRR